MAVQISRFFFIAILFFHGLPGSSQGDRREDAQLQKLLELKKPNGMFQNIKNRLNSTESLKEQDALLAKLHKAYSERRQLELETVELLETRVLDNFLEKDATQSDRIKAMSKLKRFQSARRSSWKSLKYFHQRMSDIFQRASHIREVLPKLAKQITEETNFSKLERLKAQLQKLRKEQKEILREMTESALPLDAYYRRQNDKEKPSSFSQVAGQVQDLRELIASDVLERKLSVLETRGLQVETVLLAAESELNSSVLGALLERRFSKFRQSPKLCEAVSECQSVPETTLFPRASEHRSPPPR